VKASDRILAKQDIIVIQLYWFSVPFGSLQVWIIVDEHIHIKPITSFVSVILSVHSSVIIPDFVLGIICRPAKSLTPAPLVHLFGPFILCDIHSSHGSYWRCFHPFIGADKIWPPGAL